MGYLSCRADSSVSTANSRSIPIPNPNPNSNPIKIQHFDYRDVEAATNGFSDQKLLGKGSHGSVYKAFLRGRHVAVKRPSRSNHNHQTPHELDNEIEILSKIQSPRLVNLVGITADDPTHRRVLIVEFMSNGTLYDVIHTCDKNKAPSWPRRIKLAVQTAKAVETLHYSNPPVIHRDIKSANVLIDKSFNARLGDFGLALRCHVDNFRLRSTPPAGTMGYLDPCYVTPENLSTKLDVFSFGILLLEIISGRKAIDVAHSPPSIVDWAIPLIKRGKIANVYDPRVGPPSEPVVMRQLAVIAAKCVRSCRERRPAMRDVASWLAGLEKLVPSPAHYYSWNGLGNVCMAAENVGRPVSRAHGEEEEERSRRVTRGSRRVYSDLGFSSNLMELMAGDEGSDDVAEPKSRLRDRVFGGSERFGKKGVVIARNDSIGRGSSMICSKIDDIVPRSSFRSAAGAT